MTDAVAALRACSDLHLMLARAFLPPVRADLGAAMTDLLSEDLADAATAGGLEVGVEIREFQTEMDGIGDADALLIAYSQLFLAPPVPAPLNAGLYLDGALAGPSVLAMQACYRQRGVDRSDSFRDLPDHLSVQLEFLALLLASAADGFATGDNKEAEVLCTEAASFAKTFVQSWIPQAIERTRQAAVERRLAAPYVPLLRIVGRLAKMGNNNVLDFAALAAAQSPLIPKPLQNR